MNKGIWVGIFIAVFAIVMVSISPAVAQIDEEDYAEYAEAFEIFFANITTLGGLACSDGDVPKFLNGEWSCASVDSSSISEVLKLEPQSIAPVACTVDNIGTIYLNDGPDHDGVCVCKEFGGGNHQYLEISGFGVC